MSDERFRDFDAAIAEEEPITFKLGGRQWTAANLGAASFLTYTRKLSNPEQSMAQFVTAFSEFLMDTLDKKDRRAFETMLVDKHIRFHVLRDLVDWLVAQATGVPFVEPSSSPALPLTTGERPRVVSLDPLPTTSGESASAAG